MLSVVPQVYFGEEEKGRHKREVVCRRMKLRKKNPQVLGKLMQEKLANVSRRLSDQEPNLKCYEVYFIHIG